MTTPPDQPDPWAHNPGAGSRWEQPPGQPGGQPGQPGQPQGAPPGWGAPPPPAGYGGPAQAPPPGWPQQGPAGDWSAPGYGNWAPGGPQRNGMGTAALVLGIISIVAFFTVVGGYILGILAVIFGFVGRGRVKRREADNGGAATAGIVLGFAGIVVQTAFVVWAYNFAMDAVEKCIESGQSVEYCEQNFEAELE